MRTIIKVTKQSNFVAIDNRILEDPDLSWKAKGLLSYLLSRPDNWQVRVSDLVNRSTTGRDGIYSILKELKALGYARYATARGISGTFGEGGWTVYERPRDTGSPDTAEPDTAKPDHNNTDVTHYVRNEKNTVGGKGPASAVFFENGGFPPFITKCSIKLEEHIRNRKQLLPGQRINQRYWQEQFRLLLQDLGGDKKRLIHALKNFINFSSGPYRPRVVCAHDFRKKFLPIEEWLGEQIPDSKRGPKSIIENIRTTVVA